MRLWPADPAPLLRGGEIHLEDPQLGETDCDRQRSPARRPAPHTASRPAPTARPADPPLPGSARPGRAEIPRHRMRGRAHISSISPAQSAAPQSDHPEPAARPPVGAPPAQSPREEPSCSLCPSHPSQCIVPALESGSNRWHQRPGAPYQAGCPYLGAVSSRQMWETTNSPAISRSFEYLILRTVQKSLTTHV